MDEEPTKEEMEAATHVIVARMVEQGWLSEAAYTTEIGSFVFTPDGDIARRFLRRFIISTHENAEMWAFLCFIGSTSDPSEEA